MTRIASLVIICTILLTTSSQAQDMKEELLYIGTYTPKGEGIYVYRFNRKDFSFERVQVVTNPNSPTFLAFHPSKKVLYAANEGNGTIEAYAIDAATGKLSSIGTQPAQGNGPCHVSVDPKGRFIYVSNYGSGDLAVYHLQKDGGFGLLADSIQNTGKADQKPHMHSMIPSADGKYVYASDLGIDKVLVYEVNAQTGKLKPAATPFAQLPAGAGPRHFTISENGKFAYSAAELNNTVTAFSVHPSTGVLTAIQTVSMLPENFKEKSYAADIHLSPDGKFLYASNRGHESIVTYAVDQQTGKLTLVGHESTAGQHPRNFMIDSKGEYMLVANKNTDNVVVYTRDTKTGKLTNTGKQLSLASPVCVLQYFR